MTKELKLLRQCMQQREAGVLAQKRSKLEAYASGHATLGAATVGLLALAGNEGGEGCIRVLDGDKGGWAQSTEPASTRHG
jgi:hypothetical protein